MHIHKGVNGIDEKNLEVVIIFTVLRFSNKITYISNNYLFTNIWLIRYIFTGL